MAIAKRNVKPTFINKNIEVAGKADILDAIFVCKELIKKSLDTAQSIMASNDRKGVMLQMNVSNIAERTQQRLERALLKAQRVRLSKEEREAFEKDGTLPAGVEQVVIEADDDDDNDE